MKCFSIKSRNGLSRVDLIISLACGLIFLAMLWPALRVSHVEGKKLACSQRLAKHVLKRSTTDEAQLPIELVNASKVVNQPNRDADPADCVSDLSSAFASRWLSVSSKCYSGQPLSPRQQYYDEKVNGYVVGDHAGNLEMGWCLSEGENLDGPLLFSGGTLDSHSIP